MGADPGREEGVRAASRPPAPSAPSRRRSPGVGEWPSLPARRSGSNALRSQPAAAGVARRASLQGDRAQAASGGGERDGRQAAHGVPQPGRSSRRHTSRTPHAPKRLRDLGQGQGSPRAVGVAAHVEDQVDAASDLLANSLVREPDSRHQRQGLKPPNGVLGRVRVHSRERPRMPGVQGDQQVQRLGPADLADHDAAGPHPQRVSQQVADRHLAPPLDRRRPALQPHDMGLAQAAARRRPRS